jgi:hypothetical protein
MVDGFSTGAQESVTGVLELTRPIEYIRSIIDLVMTVMGDIGVLDDLIEQIPQQVREQQQADNPYRSSEDPRLHETYRQNWYAGYLTYLTVTGYVGGSAGKALKSSSRASSIADRMSDLPGSTVVDAIEFESRLRTGGIKRALPEIRTPSGVDRSAWTGKIREFADDSAVDDALVKRYLRSINAIRQRDTIRDPDDDLYITREGKDKLVGTVLEADRAIYWESRSDVTRVEIEPAKVDSEAGPYDLKVGKTDGSTEYIEVKNVDPSSGPMDGDNIRNKVQKIQNQLDGSSLADDGTSVGTIGARRLSDELDSREAVFREIRDGIVNSDRPLQFEKLRIVVGTGANQRIKYTFDRSEFPVSGVNSVSAPSAETMAIRIDGSQVAFTIRPDDSAADQAPIVGRRVPI